MVGCHVFRTCALGYRRALLHAFQPPPTITTTPSAGALHRPWHRSGRDGRHAISPGVGDTGIPEIRSLALQVSTCSCASCLVERRDGGGAADAINRVYFRLCLFPADRHKCWFAVLSFILGHRFDWPAGGAHLCLHQHRETLHPASPSFDSLPSHENLVASLLQHLS